MVHSTDYNNLYDHADYCAREERSDEALEIYEKLARMNPDDDSVILSMAWVYQDTGRTGEALHCLEQILEKELARNVFTGFAFDELVKMYREIGEFEKLVLLCERAVAVYPSDTALLVTLGNACLRSGKPERAFQVFSTLVDLDPQAPVYYMNLGIAAVAAGKYDEAEAASVAAVRLEPEDAHIIYDKLAVAYGEAGRYERAERARMRSIKLCGDNPIYYCSLGELYLKEGRFDDARSAFEQACRIDPGSRAAFHNRLANMMLREGHCAEAIGEYEKAIHTEPGNPFYYLSLIACCEGIGEEERADRFREQARRRGVFAEDT